MSVEFTDSARKTKDPPVSTSPTLGLEAQSYPECHRVVGNMNPEFSVCIENTPLSELSTPMPFKLGELRLTVGDAKFQSISRARTHARYW